MHKIALLLNKFKCGQNFQVIFYLFELKFENLNMKILNDLPIFLPPGIKTYYLPFKPVYNQAILPSFILTIPLLRNIFIREQIEIVHAHGAFSVIGNQALFHAIFLNPDLKTVFTDHSLFGFADTSAIITNKVSTCISAKEKNIYFKGKFLNLFKP